jgi:hypothetical protein
MGDGSRHPFPSLTTLSRPNVAPTRAPLKDFQMNKYSQPPQQFWFSATTKYGRCWVRPISDFPVARSEEEAVAIYWQLRRTYGAVRIHDDDGIGYWVDDAGNLVRRARGACPVKAVKALLTAAQIE